MQYSTIPFAVKLPQEAIVFEVASLYAYLQKVVDKRHARGLLYPLAPMLAIAILAKLCGQNQLSEFADWAALRTKELVALFGLKRASMPHRITWGRILGEGVDPLQIEAVVDEFFRDQLALGKLVPARGSLVIAIDGKALKGSIPVGEKRGDYLMAAFLPEYGVVIGQVEVANGEVKENEIVAAPKLMLQLEKCLVGTVVVGDAMQCQRQLSLQIREAGGDWLWFVKENQPTVLEAITRLFEEEPIAAGHSAYPTDFEVARTVEKSHGRIEERKITISSMLDSEYLEWPYACQVFKLESWVKRSPRSAESYQVRYGISSLSQEVAGAQRLMQIARLEWGIENKLHYRRDWSLREDWSRLRLGHSQKVNAILNNIIVGVSALIKEPNLPAFRRELSYNPHRAINLLTQPLLSRL